MTDPITAGEPQSSPAASQLDSRNSLGDRKGQVIDGHDGDRPGAEEVDLRTGLNLEQRSARAVEEVRSAADLLEPQAEAWMLALRDVHSHIFGDRTSALDDALNTDLIDAYRRLYDEMLRLSTLLDPDLSRHDPEVPR